MIKDILVTLPVSPTEPRVASYARSLGAHFDAHLTGVSFAHERALQGTAFSSVPANIVSAIVSGSRNAALQALQLFEEGGRLAGVRTATTLIESSPAESARNVAKMARRFDLTILGQDEEDSEVTRLLIEAVMFESGRPVLIVPYIQEMRFSLDRVMVCWDGGAPAARAVGDAMPFLKAAGKAELVVVSKSKDAQDTERSAAEMAQHLARHQVNVVLQHLITNDLDPASMILSHAADSAANLIVMGGYGHSRMREMLFGGTTRSMLASMTAPVLMAH